MTTTTDHDTLTGTGPGSLSSILEFDHVVYIAEDGTPTDPRDLPGNHPARDALPVYAPEVYDPSGDNVEIDGDTKGWRLITSGLTGQDRYNGPWLHDSELIEGGVANRILDHAESHGGGYYVAVYATYSYECEECGGAGLVVVPVNPLEPDGETTEEDCPDIATGQCEPGKTFIEGWAIAYLPTIPTTAPTEGN